MSDAALFIGAALPWLRQIDREGADEVFNRLDSSLHLADPSLEVVVRGQEVYNARGQWVVAAAEPLTRWDSRAPTEIFRTGFAPRIAPADIGAFRQLNNMQVNILNYVVDNIASIFVSATRYVMQEGQLARWSPALTRGRYEYEIFAYGGIDINLSLRPRYNIFAHQQEITFPGGIRPGLIRSAREYDDRGRVVRVWRNLHFNPLLNGEHTPPVIDLPPLPNIVDTTNFYIVDPPDDDGEHTGHEELFRAVREAGVAASGDDDDMKDYKLVSDPWMADDVPLFPVARACMLRYVGVATAETYFFAGARFAPINLSMTNNLADTIGEGGVQNMITAWPGLHKAEFTGIDAILPVPNSDEAWFFFRDKYARVKLGGDRTLMAGPTSINGAWDSLTQAGFDAVDAILPSYNGNNQAYVFRGNRYICIQVDPATLKDSLLFTPKTIANEWASLRAANFDRVDAILPSPRGNGETWFFKGDQYVRITFDWGRSFRCCVQHTADHHWLAGPDKLVAGPSSVAGN